MAIIHTLLPGAWIWILPLVPITILLWWMQHQSNKTLNQFNSDETKFVAGKIASQMLETENISIPVEKGEDFSQNAYLPLNDKIVLSPDTIDQKDITAIGLAARAAGKAIFYKKSPQTAKLLETLRRVVQVFFWLVFTVLAFGFMGNNVPTVIIGYICLAVMLVLFFFDLSKEKGINRSIEELLKKQLPEDVLAKVQKIITADIRRF